MKHYRCQCGRSQSHGSEAPANCEECPFCHTTLEAYGDHKKAEPHKFITMDVQTDEGMKSLTRCQYCFQTKAEIEAKK